VEETVHPFGRDEPVGKTGDRTSADRLHGRQGGVRRRGKGVEEARQEVPDLEDASEGERRREKRCGLGVQRVGVPVWKRDRVRGKLRSAALLEQTKERTRDRRGRRRGYVLPVINTATYREDSTEGARNGRVRRSRRRRGTQ
jgi:hypothetical protein